MKWKRRMNKKTDYKQRLAMLKSEKPRLVVRRTNKRIIVQVVKYDNGADKTVVMITSDKLKDFGWTFSFKSLPASYLTGLIAGMAALKKGINNVVLDMGLNISTKGNKIYAAAKGFNDAGVNLKIGKDILPEESRIIGEHIKSYKNSDIVEKFKSVKESIMRGASNGQQ